MGQEITLHTDMSPADALERLRNSISPWPEWWQIFVNWHLFDEPDDEYIGTMNGNSFKISILWHGASFRRGPSLIRLKGQVASDNADKGSLIRFRVYEIWWMYLALAILWLVVFAAVTNECAGQSGCTASQITAGVFGAVWFVGALIIRSLYKGDDQALMGFLERSLEAREVESLTESSST